MLKRPGRVFLGVLWGLFFFASGLFVAPEDTALEEGELYRGPIPEDLLRPQRGEAPRYPLDMAIGALGRGEAPEAAYLFAREVSAALIAGNQDAPSLQAVNSAFREALISVLYAINPRTYRLGSGREEPDGAVSFLVRFLGREQGITGELYVRLRGDGQTNAAPRLEGAGENGQSGAAALSGDSAEAGEPETAPLSEETPSDNGGGEPAAAAQVGPVVWEFEDLILEEAQDRGVETDHRYDFPPYERFF